MLVGFVTGIELFVVCFISGSFKGPTFVFRCSNITLSSTVDVGLKDVPLSELTVD